MDLFRKCMDPVEKCLRDAKMDKGQARKSGGGGEWGWEGKGACACIVLGAFSFFKIRIIP